jgi:hypothetical protein
MINKDNQSESVSTNFHQVIPDSHFWTSLEQILNYVKTYIPEQTYLIKGLENTIEQGYKLSKKSNK